MFKTTMKTKLIFSIILLTGWFFAFSGVVSAQEGDLNLIKGVVKIIRGGDVQIISKLGTRVPLHNGDRVQTGANSKADITLKFSKEVIQLSSRSFFEVDDVNETQSKITLLTGKGQFKIPKRKLKRKRKKPRFKVRTVMAVVGVSGTEFVMGTGNEQTSLLTLSGEVTMAPVSAPDIEVIIPENQASTVVQGAAPTRPVTVPPETRANIVSSDSPETFKQVSFPKPVSIEKARKKKKQDAKKKKAEKKKQDAKKKKAEKKKQEDSKKDEKKGDEKKVDDKKDDKEGSKDEGKETGKKLKEGDEEGKGEGEGKKDGLKEDPGGDNTDEADAEGSDEGPVETEKMNVEEGDSAASLPEGGEGSEIKGTDIEEPEMDELGDDVEDILEDVENTVEDTEETVAETEAVIEIIIIRDEE
ncbi:MAG TPA: hypothetical protein EYN97_03630 [Candidatus Lambdaproteobacteria bacterium]|nr:hypothetical protein [Candidatus Lambdaproteobacteria bacterium]